MTCRMFGWVMLAAGGILLGGSTGHATQQGAGLPALNSADPSLRPTNVELYIVSQSCFQGEVVPCG